MRRLLAALLLCTSCASLPQAAPQLLPKAPPPYAKARCVTACGLRGDFDPGQCAALNGAEARVIQIYAQHVSEFRPGYASCMALDGWTVKIVSVDKKRDAKCPAIAWQDLILGCVLGETHPDTKTIELRDDVFTFNAFAHEIGHVLDAHYGTEQGVEHCGWTPRGLKTAILKATGEPDRSPENCAL
jgi:hypothetical protein